jgi:hypothetical protein
MALSRPRTVSKRLALAVLLASMLVLASALPAAAAPAATSSYYVRATDAASDAVWFDYGCAQGRADEQRPGTQNRIVILDDSLSNTTIYNFGDAAGCTQDGSTTACNNGWTQERVWWVSEGFALARPLPEIYTNSGSMARQWYQLARYTDARHSADMVIAGTLTQFGACQQVGGCTTTDNTPSQGWTQLYDLLNANPAVRHRPRWSADIRYSSVRGLAAAPPTGILDDVQGALPTSTAGLLNAWQGRAGGGFVPVYAGATAGDGEQGVVVVVTLEDDRHPTLGQQLVKTPSRSGALRVVAANGSLLTLQAEGGASFTFDAAARRFR